MSSMRAHSKHMGELGQVFRWSVQIQIYPCPQHQNCQWQEMKSSLVYVVNESPFETDELGQVFRWSAQLGQLVRWSNPDKLSGIPPVSDEVHTVTQIFRWSVQIQIYPPFSDEVLRWSAHWYPNPNKKWVHIFRWSVQISCQIYPPVSEEMLRWSAHWDPNLNGEMSSYFQMKCSDQLSDIPPKFFRWLSLC